MKKFESGQNKVEQICQILRHEAIEPAKQEAQVIIDSANLEGQRIIQEAERKAEQIIEQGLNKIEQEKSVFQSSMSQASKQSLEALRQSIEKNLFNVELSSIIEKNTADPKVIAQLINAICNAIEKEGISSNLLAIIPKQVPPQAVVSLLLDNVVKRLKDHTVSLGDFAGGAQVKIVDKRMTIDLTDQALKELITNYIRKDFRKLIFGS